MNCITCPANLATLTIEGQCIACDGKWEGGSCSGTCGEGFYYNDNGVCTTCPTDISTFTGKYAEPHCKTCGGTWDARNQICIECPSTVSDETMAPLDQGKCETCGGGWDLGESKCIACPANNSWNETKTACDACNGSWYVEGGKGKCQ